MIQADRRLLVHDFMKFCLDDPEFGYYQTQPVFGRQGDFITAPEISQMFGELVGLWLAQCWIEQDAQNLSLCWNLAPVGIHGRYFTATSKVAGFHEAMTLCL